MLPAFLVLLVLVLAATLRSVYTPGQTWNDHLIAGVVAASFAVYGVLGWGAAAALDPAGRALVLATLLLGPAAVYGLFRVLVGGPDPGWRWVFVVASQPAGAFAFWSAVLLTGWIPWALATGRHPFWPGHWLLVPLGLTAWGTLYAFRPGGPVVRHHRLVLPGLAAPVRIVHLSDVHVGPNEPAWRVSRLLARVRALQPDLVAMTGDFVTPFSAGAWRPVVQGLAGLGVPVVTCLGNHDLPDRDDLAPAMAEAGIHHLVDGRVVLDAVGRGKVEVVGVDFRWSGASVATRAFLEGLPASDALLKVLLLHDPHLFAVVPDGRFHLVLAGHLHGGPFAFDFLGLRWSPLSLLGIPDHGLHRRGDTVLYVHSGNIVAGYPPRLGTGPEIAVLEVVPG